MSSDPLLAVTVFAAVASFTPGPNNTIATVTGANFGLRAAVPHILGVPLGFASMLLAASGGVAALLLAAPLAAALLKWAGIAYLLWLALQLARPRAMTNGSACAGGPFKLPLSTAQSALFQYLNPKAWMFALAASGMYVGGAHPWQRAAVLVCICALCAMASLILWASAGAALRRWLTRRQRLRLFNAAMGATLAATAIWMSVST